MRPGALLPFLTLAVLAFSSCGGGTTDGTPSGPRIETAPIFSSTTVMVDAQLGAWSPDGTKVAFEGNLDVYVVPTTGGTPVKATNAAADWEQGGESPAFLGDGRLVYYRGWQGSDYNMHFMVAPANQANNVPAPAILHSFNGSDVGMAHNSASSPGPITLSSDGSKGVYGSWLLDWTSGSLVATQISGAVELMLCPEGTHVAFTLADGSIRIKTLATGAETPVGNGINISWATGQRLGFASGDTYKVYTLSTGTTRSYPCSPDLRGPGCPVLSPDASRILIRTFGGTSTGLSVGRLVD